MCVAMQDRDVASARHAVLLPPAPIFRLSDHTSVSLSSLQAESQTVQTGYLAGGHLSPDTQSILQLRVVLGRSWSRLHAGGVLCQHPGTCCPQTCALLGRQDVSE